MMGCDVTIPERCELKESEHMALHTSFDTCHEYTRPDADEDLQQQMIWLQAPAPRLLAHEATRRDVWWTNAGRQLAHSNGAKGERGGDQHCDIAIREV
jgi:hypothetical protein